MSREHMAHTPAGAPAKLKLKVDDLYCLACAEELEKTLTANPHVTRARVYFDARTVDVEYHAGMIDEAAIRTLINESGRCSCVGESGGNDMTHLEHRAQMAPMAMGGAHDKMQYEMPSTAAHAEHDAGHAQAMSHAGMDHDMSDPKMAKAMERDMRRHFFVALILTIPTILYSPLGSDVFRIDLPAGPFNMSWIMLVLSTPVVWWSGWIFIAGAVRSLRHRSLNMSVLIATGVLAAWGFSLVITLGDLGDTFFEAAAMLVTFVLFGHWMEMKSRRGTTDALRALFDLVPPKATVIRNGAEVEVPTSEIVVDDRVVLRPGDKVPVDGVIESGQTAIDEALVTGESVPKDKGPGDEVIGGSINKTGSVTFKATKVGAETALAQIARLVSQAQSGKAPVQRLADRVAAVFVPVVIAIAVGTLGYWLGSGAGLTFAFSATVAVLIVACPCALGLATPTALLVGTGRGAQLGILIKGPEVLESTRRVDTIVLDKTGTVTEGKMAR